MTAPDPRRAAARAVLAAAWDIATFARARSFCVGFDDPDAMIAAMERGYRPAVRRDLMGDTAADAFIAAWDSAATALGVASCANVCMPKGHDGVRDPDVA